MFREIMSKWISRFSISSSGTQSRLDKAADNTALVSNARLLSFLDPNALSVFDEQHSQDEERWVTLGLDRTGTLLVVSHTYREETATSAMIHIISARKATKNEAKQYERK
jgi:uncharacterized DUF497 family protein